MKILAWIGGAILVFLTVAMMLTAGWEVPPIDSQQTGFRGTGMVHVSNPRMAAPRLEDQLAAVPVSSPWPEDDGSPRAGDIYQNVQLLGDLSITQFNHLKQAWVEWIAPEEGCAYCHNLANMASDEVYTKSVARTMLQMNWTVNEDWNTHVGQTGVTCYTCHRGKGVPENVWVNSDPDSHTGGGMLGWNAGQNQPADQIGLSSLPVDPFSALIDGNDGNEPVRVVGRTALPQGEPIGSMQDTERTYALMIHMSTALNVNCTYCHNTRNFSTWESSPPQRVTSWFGLEMVRTLNGEYVKPLSSILPAHRLGPTGEGQKINCQTCHAGVPKPLGGLAMAELYPPLTARPSAAQVAFGERDMPVFASMEADSAAQGEVLDELEDGEVLEEVVEEMEELEEVIEELDEEDATGDL